MSTGIAVLTGSFLLGVLLPTLCVSLFVSAGAIREPVWFIGIFLMAAIPYAGISVLGAAIGNFLSSRNESKKKHASLEDSR
ncbi:MAG: hypothetical protein ABTQ25_03010 [Nitrosomonas ureae]